MSHLWVVSEAEFLCCSELRWPPQTSGTTCPTSSASETRLGSALLQEQKVHRFIAAFHHSVRVNTDRTKAEQNMFG